MKEKLGIVWQKDQFRKVTQSHSSTINLETDRTGRQWLFFYKGRTQLVGNQVIANGKIAVTITIIHL